MLWLSSYLAKGEKMRIRITEEQSRRYLRCPVCHKVVGRYWMTPVLSHLNKRGSHCAGSGMAPQIVVRRRVFRRVHMGIF